MTPSSHADTVDNCVPVPKDAAYTLRTHLGIRQDESLRIAFAAGPGDAAGTFDFWMRGEFDPRVPVIAYSTQFFSLVAQLKAEALILHEHSEGPRESDQRFRFVTVARGRDGPGWRYHLNGFIFSLRMLREIWSYRPHVVLLGADAPAFLQALLPTRSRLMQTAHNTYWPLGSRPSTMRARLQQRLITRSLTRMRGAVCTSPGCKAQMEELVGPREDILVEHPQFRRDHVPPLAPRPHNALVRRLLFLGRLEAEKGIYDLLKVFESLSPEYPDATLEFAGHGSCAQELAQAVGRSAAPVRYLGNLSADAVHAKLAETDLLICPTRSQFNEGLALVVVEAAVHGVPSLVSSNVPAKDLFPDSLSVFPVDDVAAMGAQLRKLLADPAIGARLREGLGPACAAFFDRSRSWGAQLFNAMMR